MLQRRAHFDVFELGEAAEYVFLLFGGSGIDEEEYWDRGKSLIPILNPALQSAENAGVNAIVVHVSAPFDIPYARFAEFPEARQLWNQHILSELLACWHTLPFFVCSFSGGTALAFHGVHAEQNCFGGAAIAPDGLPAGFIRPASWPEALVLAVSPGDVVCRATKNHELRMRLVERGDAVVSECPNGSHRLVDYVNNGSLRELIFFSAQFHRSMRLNRRFNVKDTQAT